MNRSRLKKLATLYRSRSRIVLVHVSLLPSRPEAKCNNKRVAFILPMDIFRTAVLCRKQAPCGCKHTDVPINGLGQCHVTHTYTVVIMYCCRVLHSETDEGRATVHTVRGVESIKMAKCLPKDCSPTPPLSLSLLS